MQAASHAHPTARQRPCAMRTPPESRQILSVDALRQVSQDGAAVNESEKQFSFTRAAPITGGRAKTKRAYALDSCNMRIATTSGVFNGNLATNRCVTSVKCIGLIYYSVFADPGIRLINC